MLKNLPIDLKIISQKVELQIDYSKRKMMENLA